MKDSEKRENLTIGVVGLGLIGGSMAKAYKQAGHAVYGYDASETVSYTHLDVYKRQNMSSLTGRPLSVAEKKPKPLMRNRPESAAVPVSYTHLDVYKRQSPA